MSLIIFSLFPNGSTRHIDMSSQKVSSNPIIVKSSSSSPCKNFKLEIHPTLYSTIELSKNSSNLNVHSSYGALWRWLPSHNTQIKAMELSITQHKAMEHYGDGSSLNHSTQSYGGFSLKLTFMKNVHSQDHRLQPIKALNHGSQCLKPQHEKLLLGSSQHGSLSQCTMPLHSPRPLFILSILANVGPYIGHNIGPNI